MVLASIAVPATASAILHDSTPDFRERMRWAFGRGDRLQGKLLPRLDALRLNLAAYALRTATLAQNLMVTGWCSGDHRSVPQVALLR